MACRCIGPGTTISTPTGRRLLVVRAFEFIFPDPTWVWNWLPAAHTAAVTFDLLTVAGLIHLGRRLRPGANARRPDVVVALGRPRTVIVFGVALSVTAGAIIWASLPPEELSLFWARTLGFQLRRHSFMGIWDQYPSSRRCERCLRPG